LSLPTSRATIKVNGIMPTISMFYGIIVHMAYREDLLTAWALAREGQAVDKIEPLR
jgi:hypothetical protein